MQVNTHHSESRETEEIRKKNPWWIPRFIFGSIPVLESRKVTLLGCVTIAILYENYDISLLLTTLEKISLGLDIDETQLGYFVSQIRFGGLFSLLVIPFADIFGRRRLMLLSIICLSLGTCATAFSQTPGQFVFLQVFTRTFILTAAAIAIVLISEEFPARHRGWAFGILGAGAAVGYFFGALFFAAVDWFPYGWRALYFIGIIPLFRMPMFRGGIYETKRFREYRGAHRFLNFQHAWRSWFGPYARLGRTYPWRVGGLALMGMLSAGGFITVISFIGYYLLAYRDFQSWQLSTVLILCGSFLIPGNVLAGRLADLIGRKKNGIFLLNHFSSGHLAFFHGFGHLELPGSDFANSLRHGRNLNHPGALHGTRSDLLWRNLSRVNHHHGNGWSGPRPDAHGSNDGQQRRPRGNGSTGFLGNLHKRIHPAPVPRNRKT